MTHSTLPSLSFSEQRVGKLLPDLSDPLIREIVMLANKYIAHQDEMLVRYGQHYDAGQHLIIRKLGVEIGA